MLVHKMLKQMLLFTEVKQTNKTEKKIKKKKVNISSSLTRGKAY